MNESLINDKTLREYLLGRVTDEALLAEIEERLFLDEDLCSLAEIEEDELVNDYVFGRLSTTDAADLAQTFENNPDRRAKSDLTKALRAKAAAISEPEPAAGATLIGSLRGFFQRPLYAGGFAVLVIAILVFSFFALRRQGADELADLRAIYQDGRPTEARIAGFDYAPVGAVRGSADERDAARLRLIAIKLLENAEKNPSAATHHAVGVFYLTQQNFPLAIESLTKAVAADQNDAGVRNDLGSAYFEMARSEPAETRLAALANALENFSRATELDATLLAAFFNKSLCLQELRLNEQAREAWTLYLEKDPSSKWADEARKHLELLDKVRAGAKTPEMVLDDLLAAYRASDAETVWKIDSETREMITGLWLPDQLARRFLAARSRGDDPVASESLAALRYIGDLEKTRNADFFVSDMADVYSQTTVWAKLSQAKQEMGDASKQLNQKDIAKAKSGFDTSKALYIAGGDQPEAMIAELWVAQSLTDLSEINESNAILARLRTACDAKRYRWLGLVVSDWAGNNLIYKNELTRSLEIAKTNLVTAKDLSDGAMRSKISNVIAYIYIGMAEYGRALEYLGPNIDRVDAYQRDEIRVWQTCLYAATATSKLKKYETADSIGREALAIIRNSQNASFNKAQVVDDTLRLLLGISRSKKDYPRALSYADETLRSAQSTADATFKAKMVQYATLEIAELKREMGNFEEALEMYDRSLDALRTTPEVEIDNYAAEKGKLLCLVSLGREQEIDDQLKVTLDLSEKMRSVILDAEARDTFFDTEQDVYDLAVEHAIRSRDQQKAFYFAEMSKARTLLDFVGDEASINDIEKRFPSVATPYALKEIQSRQPSSTQIVEYSLLTGKLVIWIITKDRFESIEVPVSAGQIDADIAGLLDLVTKDVSDTAEIKVRSSALYDLLIAPVLDRLDPQKDIVFVPDKGLYKTPFAALFSNRTGRFLIEDFTVSYSPSANVFVKTSETARQRVADTTEDLLSVGDPAFDRDMDPGLSYLPTAGTEARAIAEYYGESTLLTGADASKDAVLKHLPSASVFHFAGHYVTNSASLPNSRLLLAKRSGDSDLRLSEITGERLSRSKLVVLSACETNGEKLFQGEGAVGVAQTFLAIGAPAVVASGWKVNSEVTRDLMIAFHRHRKADRLRVAEALRQAQTELLRGDSARSPYYWAAFSLVGGFTAY